MVLFFFPIFATRGSSTIYGTRYTGLCINVYNIWMIQKYAHPPFTRLIYSKYFDLRTTIYQSNTKILRTIERVKSCGLAPIQISPLFSPFLVDQMTFLKIIMHNNIGIFGRAVFYLCVPRIMSMEIWSQLYQLIYINFYIL